MEKKIRLTTICYIEKDGCYLMLHRTKKKNDQSHDKWLGIGGKIEKDESPDECIVREVYEETGLILKKYEFRGMMTFLSDVWDTEYMFLFTADEFSGQMKECDEGDLEWVPKDRIKDLHLWEGDLLFLEKFEQTHDFFSLKARYEGDKLVNWKFGA